MVFINGTGAVYHVDGIIGRSSAEKVESQLDEMFEEFDKDNGSESGMMVVMDNASWKHKDLENIFTRFCYYTPETEEQATIWNGSVMVETLHPDVRNGSNTGTQLYVLRELSTDDSDDGNFVLTTTAGMEIFQPCEFLFSYIKESLARLPLEAVGKPYI